MRSAGYPAVIIEVRLTGVLEALTRGIGRQDILCGLGCSRAGPGVRADISGDIIKGMVEKGQIRE
jgi:hypothetical protein